MTDGSPVRDVAALLADLGLFADLEPDARAVLGGCARLVHRHDAELVFAEGEPADACYVLRTGRVVLELHAPGRGPIGVASIEPGEMLGWSWLHPPYAWQLDARAVGEASLIAFDAACLRTTFTDDPRLGYAVMCRFAETASRRLHATRFQLLDLYGHRSAPGASA